jgi:hypothetical protein
MISFCCRIGLLLAVLFVVIVPATAQPAQVESVRVHLFKENTGTLSDDIVTNNPGLWNVIIGDNQAESFLVSIVISGKPDSYDDKGFVVVSVYDDDKKKLVAKRTFRGFLFGKEGRTYKPVFVEHLTCSRVRIVARTRAGEKSETVTFRCGE